MDESSRPSWFSQEGELACGVTLPDGGEKRKGGWGGGGSFAGDPDLWPAGEWQRWITGAARPSVLNKRMRRIKRQPFCGSPPSTLGSPTNIRALQEDREAPDVRGQKKKREKEKHRFFSLSGAVKGVGVSPWSPLRVASSSRFRAHFEEVLSCGAFVSPYEPFSFVNGLKFRFTKKRRTFELYPWVIDPPPLPTTTTVMDDRSEV